MNTQLDQYTDLSDGNMVTIDEVMPKGRLQNFRGGYLDTALRLMRELDNGPEKITEDVDQLDFEFVLFASSVIDYIRSLIADYSKQQLGEQEMTRPQLIGLIQSDAKFLDDCKEIAAYIDTLTMGEGMNERGIREGFKKFKSEKNAKALSSIADKCKPDVAALQRFVEAILRRMIFEGEGLRDLMAPLDMSWKARTQKELALMENLIPLLRKRACGREIAGLEVYEQ